MEYPEYVHIDEDITAQDIRDFLEEACGKGVSNSTMSMFTALSTTHPKYRLVIALKKVLGMLACGNITDVLMSGLAREESDALIELDRRHVSYGSRMTAMSLLCVKERWLLVKSVRGLFTSARSSNAYLKIADEEYDDDT